MSIKRKTVTRWESDWFVDGWAFAILECGHRVMQKNRRRPKTKPCFMCYVAESTKKRDEVTQ